MNFSRASASRCATAIAVKKQQSLLARRRLAIASCIVLSAVLLACTNQAEGDTSRVSAASEMQASVDSARSVLADFYSWYVPVALGPSSGERTWYRVLDERASVLSGPLLQLLRADRELQRAASGVIAGLEGDPFLNSQDPCPDYVVGSAMPVNSAIVITIEPRCGADQQPQKPFKAVLISSGKLWVLSDFEYPGEFGGTLTERLRR